MLREVLKVFIRWKGRYAYLEQRYLDHGKVKSRSKYLGQNPLEALAKMFSGGEIDQDTYEKITRWEPEGILQMTFDGGLNFSRGTFGFLKGNKIGVFFGKKWFYGLVDKDEHGWHLVDESGNIVGLRPGMKARLRF